MGGAGLSRYMDTNGSIGAAHPFLQNHVMPAILIIDDNASVGTALDVLFSLHDIDTLQAQTIVDDRLEDGENLPTVNGVDKLTFERGQRGHRLT